MKKINGLQPSVFTMLASAILAALVSANTGDTNQNNASPSGISASILEQAQKAFQNGQKCYIWKEKNTIASSAGFAIVIEPFSVLASPENDGITYDICYRFIAVDKGKGKAELVPIRLTNFAGPDKASAKESRWFTVLIPLTFENTKYSGKGMFEFFLTAPDGDQATISNMIQMEVDLDNSPMKK